MKIVFKVSDNVKEKMIEYYMDKRREKTPPYAIFQAEEADTIITLYASGKAMFQGTSADIDANLWKDMEKHLNGIDIDKEEKEKEKKDKSNYYFSAIGSDEVGTGDYLLPIVVTASFVDKKDIAFLEKLKIHDSKKMTDEKIKKCAPILIKKIPHESLILSNETYNEYYKKGININKIKALLHNKLLYKMTEKDLPYQKIIVDQFALPKVYFSYLKDEEEKVTKITFLTKAEDKNLSVAVSSVISRYLFLQEKDRLEKLYETELPKGASNIVDEKGKLLVKTHGEEILNKIAKLNFSNTDKILNE